ncbi:MAG: WYL domain-containing protein [Acidimicrobiales bacterium]|nr:WYL domain-containing protein [Acidimicrobiales bacterium]
MPAPKLERLLNLTALLLAARLPVTAEQIQRELGYPEDQAAFRRAFERDKDELRSMGIPLRVERVPGRMPEVDGYRIPREEYALRDPGLTTDELAALHLAASAVQVEGMSPTAGLLKLGGLVPTAGGHEIGVRVANLPADPNLSLLFGAVSSRRPVRVRYHDREREVDPYRLEFQRGRWYLTGRDHSHDEERNFRLDRVQGSVEVLEGPTFEGPPTATPGRARGPWALGGDAVINAKVQIDGPQARWAIQHLGPDNIVSVQGEDSVVVELPVTNRQAFRSFVLGFLDHAEVLEPPELRDEIVAWLEAMAG